MNKDARFGEWSIDQKVLGWLLSNIPVGSSILEFGSGWATGELARYYTMHSVEDNEFYVGKYDSHYIYAKSDKGWYDKAVLERELPKIHYDCILIDGPGHYQRKNILEHTGLLNWNQPVVMDDCQEGDILSIALELARNYCKRPLETVTCDKKMFAVIK